MMLCVDCDNVLNNLTEKTLELYNSQSGKNIQMSDIISYNFYECLPQEDADGIVSLFKEKEQLFFFCIFSIRRLTAVLLEKNGIFYLFSHSILRLLFGFF